VKKLLQIVGVFLIVSNTSCKKVIQLDLHESDVKIVVEGIVTNEPGVCKVSLTKSKFFYEDNQFEKISGAQVKVSDNGVDFVLTETSPGIYETHALTGIPGHKYDLRVLVNNQQFTASSVMPQPVSIDTVYVAPGPFGEFKFANIGYTDPAATSNNYRFVQYLNGVKDPAIFWQNDEFTNGQKVYKQLDTGVDKKDDPRSIKTGDSVTVEMQCIDEAVYKYWYSLHNGGGQGGGNVAAPANPITNIQGGALGYFSAYSVARRTVIAP
jgi:hypothetical protein